MQLGGFGSRLTLIVSSILTITDKRKSVGVLEKVIENLDRMKWSPTPGMPHALEGWHKK